MNRISIRAAAVLLCLSLMALCFAGCQNSSTPAANVSPVTSTTSATTAAPEDISLYGIAGPTGIGLVQLMQAVDNKSALNNYTLNIVSAPTDAVAALTSGAADIAAVPTNLAASLYQKTEGKVQILAVNTLGVLSIMEKGDTINTVADLKGKTIYSTGQGANPEYILNYVLKQNGLTPGTDVTIEYLEQNDELLAKIVSGEAEVAMVPQPLATTVQAKVSDMRYALSMTDEWEKVSNDSQLMMGCVVATADFIQNHAGALDNFMKEYQASIESAILDPASTAKLCETYSVIPSAAIAEKAIPQSNLCFVTGSKMKSSLSQYLQVLFDQDPKAVGGKMPDDAFYFSYGA